MSLPRPSTILDERRWLVSGVRAIYGSLRTGTLKVLRTQGFVCATQYLHLS